MILNTLFQKKGFNYDVGYLSFVNYM